MAGRDQGWLDAIRYAVLDLSGPWRLAFDTLLPDAVQVADPFHLVKLANQRLDEVRRWVQNETECPSATGVTRMIRCIGVDGC